METVQKFTLQPASGVSFRMMPKGARLVSAGIQCDQIAVWARVDVDQPMVNRRIVVTITGQVISPGTGDFIDTVVLEDGSFVLHVFDGGEA